MFMARFAGWPLLGLIKFKLTLKKMLNVYGHDVTQDLSLTL